MSSLPTPCSNASGRSGLVRVGVCVRAASRRRRAACGDTSHSQRGSRPSRAHRLPVLCAAAAPRALPQRSERRRDLNSTKSVKYVRLFFSKSYTRNNTKRSGALARAAPWSGEMLRARLALVAVWVHLEAGVGVYGCTDDAKWDNGAGKRCDDYAAKYCAGGHFLAGSEWAGGATFRHPELHCCACGNVTDFARPDFARPPPPDATASPRFERHRYKRCRTVTSVIPLSNISKMSTLSSLSSALAAVAMSACEHQCEIIHCGCFHLARDSCRIARHASLLKTDAPGSAGELSHSTLAHSTRTPNSHTKILKPIVAPHVARSHSSSTLSPVPQYSSTHTCSFCRLFPQPAYMRIISEADKHVLVSGHCGVHSRKGVDGQHHKGVHTKGVHTHGVRIKRRRTPKFYMYEGDAFEWGARLTEVLSHPPTSPICRTPLFPHLTFLFFFRVLP